MILAASAVQITLIVLAIIGLVALATWFLKRRRRDIWQELARKRGLTFVEPPDGPRITGEVAGRLVSVAIEDAGSDRDVGGVEVVRMSVGLQYLPRGMTAEGVPGIIGDLATLAEDRIEFDQEDFQRDVLVKAEDKTLARAYWSEERQQAFLNLVRSAPCDQITLGDGVLTAALREIVSDRRQLEQLLDLLLEAAPRLDGTRSDPKD